ncbi:hypothetical protein DFH09DRAFT_1318249 [Mycena vulgaris]|nr:hypothetical protein DFH09DRAFT_1318249 [Mycena vulgaris]
MLQIFYISGIACLSLALLFNLLTTISQESTWCESAPRTDSLATSVYGECVGILTTKTQPPVYSLAAAMQSVRQRRPDPGLVGLPFNRSSYASTSLHSRSCLKHEKGPILASLPSLLTALFTFIAFILNIVFYVNISRLFAEHEKRSPVHSTIIPSSAIWLTFVSMILILLGGGTVFFGHYLASLGPPP